MYIIALATDYDGTLAEHGRVLDSTLDALKRFKATGRRLILVTGRELPHLKEAFPAVDLFDRVVAENGAVLYHPAAEKERDLAPPPSPALVEMLKAKGVAPLSAGRTIVATWEPHENTVLECVRALGLELEIVFNKGAVMVLPSGVNKATGLAVALDDLGISAHNVAGIGDAENDHTFLRACGCPAAVANALPAVKASAHVVTRAMRGAGVAEFMARIETEDGAIMPPDRHAIAVGDTDAGEVSIPSYGRGVLIAGQSGIGKSTLATGLTEQMCDKGFQFCVFDPEGDYQELEHAIVAGDAKVPPTADGVFSILEKAGNNAVVNTLALGVPERPTFFAQLMPNLLAMRAKLGRPHWLVIDEAHHLLPADRSDVVAVLPEEFHATIFITVHPEAVSPNALRSVDTVIAIGPQAADVISAFCRAIEIEPPALPQAPRPDEVLFWRRGGRPPFAVKARIPKKSHKRHTKKYAEGALGEESSFYFRGPDGALNLRAQNTTIFLQMAEGVDDATWEYHLRRGDYSDWFRTRIKDPELADEATAIEQDTTLNAQASRARVAEAVHRRYTAPAKAAAAE